MNSPLVLSRLRLRLRARRYRRSSDRAEIAAILALLRLGDTAIDVGVHKGAYLYWMRRAVGPGGQVYGFEPQRAAAQGLQKLAATPRWSNVVVEELALSDAIGEAALFLPPGIDRVSSAATLQPPDHWEGEGGMSSCQTTSLDAWSSRRSLDRLDFVKCDVEGHELAVLRGSRNTLNRWHPSLLIECELRHAGPEATSRLFEQLAGLGYSGSFFYRGESLPIEEFEPARHQRVEDYDTGRSDDYANNFLFVHPERRS